MAEVTLTLDTPVENTLPSTAGLRRRVVMPATPQGRLVVRSSASIDVEFVDAADESAAGTPARTLPPNTDNVLEVGRGELAISGASSQVVRLTAIRADADADIAGGLRPQIVWLESSTPDLDPNGIITSATQDADGWVTITCDASGAVADFPQDGAMWWTDLYKAVGRTPFVANAHDPIRLFLEVRAPPTGCGPVLLCGSERVSGSWVGTANIAASLYGDGTGWQSRIQRAGATQGNSGTFEAALRRVHMAWVPGATNVGNHRAQGLSSTGADGSFVDAIGTINNLTGFGNQLAIGLGVINPAVGGAAETFDVRASVLAMSAADWFDRIKP